MTRILKVLVALALSLEIAHADTQFDAPMFSRSRFITLYSGNSPSTATTAAQTAVTGLDVYHSCWIVSYIRGGTGGTLDVYIQSSFDGGTTWVDHAHYTQLAAGGSLVAWSHNVSGPTGGTAPTSVNTVSGTPTLAANTVVQGTLGNALRVVFVSGSGTSAGAAQAIYAYCRGP